MRRRSGMSLIELVVVISMIGLLVALILPAIHGAREAARRAACKSNLHQIGIALTGYSSNHGVYPGIDESYSVMTRLLPHLDRATLYNSMNFSLSILYMDGLDSNQTAMRSVVSAFLCPSDDTRAVTYAPSNYPSNWGSGVLISLQSPSGPFSVAGARSAISNAQIRDGLQSTVGVSEMLIGVAGLRRDKKRSVFYLPLSVSDREQFDGFVQECGHIASDEASLDGLIKASSWVIAEFGITQYNHNLNPNNFTCKHDGYDRQGAWTASSSHEDGVNSLFMDGHVQFIRSNVNLSVWRGISTIAGGEIVPLADH